MFDQIAEISRNDAWFQVVERWFLASSFGKRSFSKLFHNCSFLNHLIPMKFASKSLLSKAYQPFHIKNPTAVNFYRYYIHLTENSLNSTSIHHSTISIITPFPIKLITFGKRTIGIVSPKYFSTRKNFIFHYLKTCVFLFIPFSFVYRGKS